MVKGKGIREQALKLTGQPAQKKGEDNEAFLERMLVAIPAAPDDDFNAMSDELYQWYSDAANARKLGDVLPGFYDEDAEEEEDDELDGELDLELEEEEDELAQEDEEPEPTPAPEPTPKAKPIVKRKERKGQDQTKEKLAVKASRKAAEVSNADPADEAEAPPAPTARRGRGRPKGSQNGARTQTSEFRKLVLDVSCRPLLRKELIQMAEKGGLKLHTGSFNAVLYHTEETLDMLREAGYTVPPARPDARSR